MHRLATRPALSTRVFRLAVRPASASRAVRVPVVLATAVVVAALAATPASAHAEKRAGDYTFVVGLGEEPAYAGQPNSLQVIISRDGQPATDLADELDGLAAHAYYGARADAKADKIELPLEPYFGDGWGTPGDYRSFFVPTQPGTYTIQLHGTLGGQKVDLTIPSGPDTFGNVLDPAKTAFPALRDPTTGQLAERLEREATRLTARVEGAASAQRAAEDAARQARSVGLAGLLVGLAGLVVAGLALARARRPSAPAPLPHPDAVAGKV
jgi:hypothetical protein